MQQQLLLHCKRSPGDREKHSKQVTNLRSCYTCKVMDLHTLVRGRSASSAVVPEETEVSTARNIDWPAVHLGCYTLVSWHQELEAFLPATFHSRPHGWRLISISDGSGCVSGEGVTGFGGRRGTDCTCLIVGITGRCPSRYCPPFNISKAFIFNGPGRAEIIDAAGLASNPISS
ncbi:hypothetical protein FA95DRAFT_186581 [Auriscalpium vulgare]|uniref:Uncharacterized protein n=1 Tax=Auriscalpium vulgare TaxID=40419 RepID=A0ACB8RMP6_9AGAM|nr:hypothetical protein FA95DRAFT_186581 [Auriscalpium vulgare]